MKNYIYMVLIASSLFTACQKDLTVAEPTVNIVLTNPRSTIADTLVFKLGDTCKFAIDGYADNITFWGGTNGNNYAFKNRTRAFGKLNLSFTSTAQWGAQTNTLQVLAISKLASRDSATVVNANWTNITSRTPLATSATAVNTGNVNLTDLVTGAEDSLFIAFKYTGITGSTQRTWTITNYILKNEGSNFSSTISSLPSDISYWVRYGNVWTPANARWTATSSALTIVGGGATAPSNTSWLVSKPIYVGRITPDVFTATVKNLTSSETNAYAYTYPTTGTYKATFVAFNNTVNEQKTVIKEFFIKITP